MVSSSTHVPPKGIFLIIFTLKITIFSVAITFHVIGIAATCLYKKRTNQNLILFFLSIVELSLCIIGIINRFHDDFGEYNSEIAAKALHGVEYIFIHQLAFVMYILTIDRLICICSPLKYKLRVSKTKISIAFISTLAISILLGILEHASNSINVKQAIWYVHIFILASFVLVAITTYIIAFYKLRKSAKRFSTPGSSKETKKTLKKQFLVAGLLILTFFLLYTIPSAVLHIHILGGTLRQEDYERFKLYSGICQIFMISGLVADAVTYIFLSRHYRRIIVSWFKCCQQDSLQNQSTISGIDNSGFNEMHSL